MALSGVLSSWLMLARKSDLWRLATSSCLPFSAISRNRRAFWIAIAEFLAALVVLLNRAAVEAGQLPRALHDGLQHGLQVERRADRVPHLAQRRELPHRACERLRARLQLLEQSHVLDRDHRLVGEGLEQFDLMATKLPHLAAPHGDNPDRAVVPHHRNAEHAAETP